MNIFVFSSSRITRAVVFNIEYVLNVSIDNIIVLKENHDNNDFPFSQNRILLINSLADALSFSDIVIVIDNGKIPENRINRIKSYTLKNHKRLVYIRDNKSNQEKQLAGKCDFIHAFPKIINVGIGDDSLSYYSEIYLNKYFCKNNIKIFQRFTHFTIEIINILNNESLLNPIILMETEISKVEKPELCIYSLFFNDIYSMIDSLDYITSLKPDLIMFNGNARIDEQFDLETLVKYRLGCSTIIVKSKYINIQKDENNCRLILCRNNLCENCIDGDGFDTFFEREFKRCFTFPDNIYLI